MSRNKGEIKRADVHLHLSPRSDPDLTALALALGKKSFSQLARECVRATACGAVSVETRAAILALRLRPPEEKVTYTVTLTGEDAEQFEALSKNCICTASFTLKMAMRAALGAALATACGATVLFAARGTPQPDIAQPQLDTLVSAIAAAVAQAPHASAPPKAEDPPEPVKKAAQEPAALSPDPLPEISNSQPDLEVGGCPRTEETQESDEASDADVFAMLSAMM